MKDLGDVTVGVEHFLVEGELLAQVNDVSIVVTKVPLLVDLPSLLIHIESILAIKCGLAI